MIMLEQDAPTTEASFKQTTPEPLLIGCPICGRPAKVRHEYVDRELACSHCQGTFVVNERMDGRKTTQSTTSTRRPKESISQHDAVTSCRSHGHATAPRSSSRRQSSSRPTAFIVEARDEVYARLAGDLVEAGYRVVRAISAKDALKACGKYQPRLVVAGLNPGEGKAWKLAPKLAMLDDCTRVVLYGNEIAIHDHAMADFLGIAMLVEYGGDLLRLSSRIRSWLRSEFPIPNESNRPAEPAQRRVA